MPIPTTRAELLELITKNRAKLLEELDAIDDETADLACTEDWTIADLLAVRAWWTENVVEWIEAGRRGEKPVTPAPGYGWRETPRLNDDIVAAAKGESYREKRARLERGMERVFATIDSLSDEDLLEAGRFEWAGKYPLSRLLSINTSTQYASARKLIRAALRSR